MMPNGTKQLVPEDEGNGIMLSSFTCCKLGYGCPISNNVLEAVNLCRKGKEYSDETAAHSRLGLSEKSDLTSTPFSICTVPRLWCQYQWVLDLQPYDCPIRGLH